MQQAGPLVLPVQPAGRPVTALGPQPINSKSAAGTAIQRSPADECPSGGPAVAEDPWKDAGPTAQRRDGTGCVGVTTNPPPRTTASWPGRLPSPTPLPLPPPSLPPRRRSRATPLPPLPLAMAPRSPR
ncbi:hypothetical protein SEVIR_6G069250v4 [Setaria viridis]